MPSNSSSNYLPIAATNLNFQASLIHQAKPLQEIKITLHLFQPSSAATNQELLSKANKVLLDHPLKRTYLTHDELETLVGASHDDVNTIDAFFKEFKIKTIAKNLLARTVTLTGAIGAFAKAFRTKFNIYQGPNQITFLAYEGALQLPAEMHKVVQSVSGILTPLKTEYRKPTPTPQEVNAAIPTTGYTAQQLATAYNFPKNLTGKGQTIGIIELGGVYKKSDVETYFKMMKLPLPKIIEVGTPIDDGNMLNNSEVTLDLEVVGTIAPRATLVIYYGHTILEAMKLIIQDTTNKPSVISISWAGSEYNYNAFQISELNQVFYEASLLGMTLIAASGDHGAMNGKQFLNVSIPSSNPLVVGCGGTNVTLNEDNAIVSEVVWNQGNGQIGSGGGFSALYPVPTYQQSAVAYYPYVKGNSRGVPDLAANADSIHGYIVIFNGIKMPIGGTSASTPLVAGLFALMNESFGTRLGFVNTWLYQFANRGFFPITQGNNGYYPAAPYWNPATGLGSPNGEKLLELFKTGK